MSHVCRFDHVEGSVADLSTAALDRALPWFDEGGRAGSDRGDRLEARP